MDNSDPSQNPFHIHLVSDATGGTVMEIARACLAQFDVKEPAEHFWNLVRSERQLQMVIEGLRRYPGLLFYTIFDESLRAFLENNCQALNAEFERDGKETRIVAVPVMDRAIDAMANYLGLPVIHRIGGQHVLDEDYYKRIDAMEYAMATDDGNGADKLKTADVVLVGVSRTSKTPTCFYLAQRGIRASNIPIVPHVPLPEALFQTKALVIGLTRDYKSLSDIRTNRLQSLSEDSETSYTDMDAVKEEVTFARKLCTNRGWPVIDVTRRSIEETAAEIINQLEKRRNAEGSQTDES
jgi:[pyruvate, water dikinase]-phosphate phosphotransferase / [pyruvate, water dikinase] kinase